ncbi:uncharacterized protein DUF938 [Roseateles toxinivorans]|uniref:Uncharacterized protein DUF938 n=2 Tax=Roseateles toxinivorans TaxID=270368 RepID=A0A4R6QJR7_9BURK|nr:uncharacterized protein DUF938 [Roseateles toxinivorans]
MTPQSPRMLNAPAAERNKQPILEVLQRLLPAQGVALEIASGTGQHAAHFAAGLARWTWQPSDYDAANLASIAAWTAGLANVLPAIQLDVLAPVWPLPAEAQTLDAIFCANMLHISPWPTCAALMQGAARHLSPLGRLITYGPYRVPGVATAPSNEAFDADLRARNPAWGLRGLDDVKAEALRADLQLIEQISMPANNLLLVFARG